MCQVDNQQYYMGPLTLCDGGEVNGSAQFRFGNTPAYPWIYSLGSTSMTNAIKCGMRLYRTKDNRSQFGTFYTLADLSLGSKITCAIDAGYEGALIKKRGPAKLILTPECTNPDAYSNTARVEVVEGTLRNESATALRDCNSVELHDGVAYEAVGNSQSIGKLVVDAKYSWATTQVGATVKFEQGGTLALPENGLEMADSATLLLGGDFGGKSFRVGTSRCLSNGVLDRMRIVSGGRSRRVVQNSDGYVVACGCLLIVR